MTGYIQTARDVISQYPSLNTDKLKLAAFEQIKSDPDFIGRAHDIAHKICSRMQNLIYKREREDYDYQ